LPIARKCLGLTLCLLAPAMTRAQGVEPVFFDEYLVGSGPTKSPLLYQQSLVGLTILRDIEARAPEARVNLADQQFAADVRSAEMLLCTSLATPDGRYSGRSVHTFTDRAHGILNVPYPSQYGSDLAQYKEGDMVILARVSSDCEDRMSAQFIPRVLRGPDDAIRVLLNLGRSVPAVEFHTEAVADGVPASCGQDVQAMYTHQCIIPLPPGPWGRSTLTVTARGLRGETRTDTYYLALP